MTTTQKQKQKEQLSAQAEFEQFKNEVLVQELEARHAEAMFKKMDFYIKASKITPEFLEVRKKEREEFLKIQQEQAQELESLIKDQVETQNEAKIITLDN